MFDFQPEILLLILIVFPALGALLGFLIGPRHEDARNRFTTFISFGVFVIVCYLYPYVDSNLQLDIPFVMGTGLFLELNMLRYVLLFISALAFLLAQIFSLRYLLYYKNRNRYYLFYLLTLSSTLGVFMSCNVINLFTFFEIMTITSYFLVIHDEDEFTHKAGNIYIAMSFAGGLTQLMGIFLVYNYTNTLMLAEMAVPFQALGTMKYIIAGLVIVGFGVKACMFPLHIWLPKVYSPTPSPATAIFSGILTKTGVFGIYLVLSSLDFDIPLSYAIIIIGLINMLLGGFLALHHRNIKKVLAYSSMSQLGYIFLAMGLMGVLHGHTTMAYYGSVFHMINHAITKVSLFFGTGVIFMITQRLSLNEIRGFGKHKPLYRVLFLIGTLGTIGIPGFSGYASKTMIHHAILEAGEYYNIYLVRGVEVAYYIASAFTVAYLLKLYVTIFLEDNPEFNGEHKRHLSFHTYGPMVVVAGLVILIGLFPNTLLQLIGIGHAEGYHGIEFFGIKNLLSALIIFVLGAFIYLFYVIGKLKIEENGEYIFVNPTHHWFDLEKHLYKPVLLFIYKYVKIIIEVFDNILVIGANNISNLMKYIFSIEFYKDVSYYKRIANYLVSLKYRTLKMNRADHSHKDAFEYIEDIQDHFEYAHAPEPHLIDEAKEYVESVHNMASQSKEELIAQGQYKSKSVGFMLSSMLSKLSSITYSIIIFALILAALLFVMVVV